MAAIFHRLFGFEWESLQQLYRDSLASFRLETLPEDLARRGVEDLAEFPYAEDGLAFHAILERLCVDYLDAVALPDSAGMPQRRNRTPSEGMLRCLYALNRAPVRPLLRPPSKAGLHALRRALVLLDRVDGGRTGGLLGARLPPVIDRAGLALAQRVCIDRIDALFNDWLSAEDRPWFEPSTAGPKRRDQD